jgi:hypothetical protein
VGRWSARSTSWFGSSRPRWLASRRPIAGESSSRTNPYGPSERVPAPPIPTTSKRSMPRSTGGSTRPMARVGTSGSSTGAASTPGWPGRCSIGPVSMGCSSAGRHSIRRDWRPSPAQRSAPVSRMSRRRGRLQNAKSRPSRQIPWKAPEGGRRQRPDLAIWRSLPTPREYGIHRSGSGYFWHPRPQVLSGAPEQMLYVGPLGMASTSPPPARIAPTLPHEQDPHGEQPRRDHGRADDRRA